VFSARDTVSFDGEALPNLLVLTDAHHPDLKLGKLGRRRREPCLRRARREGAGGAARATTDACAAPIRKGKLGAGRSHQHLSTTGCPLALLDVERYQFPRCALTKRVAIDRLDQADLAVVRD